MSKLVVILFGGINIYALHSSRFSVEGKAAKANNLVPIGSDDASLYHVGVPHMPDKYSWLSEEDEGFNEPPEDPPAGVVAEHPYPPPPSQEEQQATQFADRRRKEADVLSALAKVRSNPWSVGCEAGGVWEEFVETDEECTRLLDKEKPRTNAPIQKVSDFIHMSLARCTFIDAPDVLTLQSFPHDNPLQYLAAKDITQMMFALIARELVQPHTFPTEGGELEFLCDSYGPQGGLDTRTACPSTIAATALAGIVDAMHPDNQSFGDALADAVCDTGAYWLAQPPLGPRSTTVQQVFREALLRAGMKASPSNSSYSVSLAHFVGGYLHTISKGTTSVNVFRRNDRARFQRIPIFSTLTNDYPSPDTTDTQPGSTATLPIMEEDVIVLLTDGVTDNMYMNEISSLVSRAVTPHDSLMLHDAENQLHQRGVEWDIPSFNYRSNRPSDPLRFTTNPSHLAAAIAFSARQHIAADPVAGPHVFNTVLQGKAGPLTTRADDTSAVVCYATSKEHAVSLFDLWNLADAQFKRGSPSLVRQVAQ